MLARAAGGVLRPLTVVRQDEIVIVRALDGHDPRQLTEPIEQAQHALASAGVGLAVGVSTAFETTAGLPDAYAEAGTAITSLGPGGGVMALVDLSAFEYLTLRSDTTALRLIAPAVRRLVEEGAAGGGALTSTLVACVEANLNAKVAARRLYIRVNTPHHRFGRIEEKTGCDLRDLADVPELLIAIKLATGRPGPGAESPPQG